MFLLLFFFKMNLYDQKYLKNVHSPLENGWIEFSFTTGLKICTKWQCSIILLHKLKLHTFSLINSNGVDVYIYMQFLGWWICTLREYEFLRAYEFVRTPWERCSASEPVGFPFRAVWSTHIHHFLLWLYQIIHVKSIRLVSRFYKGVWQHTQIHCVKVIHLDFYLLLQNFIPSLCHHSCRFIVIYESNLNLKSNMKSIILSFLFP